MAEEVKIAPTQESEAETESASSEAETAQDGGKDETIGEALGTEEPKEKTVPLSAFLELKNATKAAQREIKLLQAKIEEGTSRVEVTADIKALAEKHNLDESFLQEFASKIRADAKKDTDDEVSAKLKPLQEKERAEKIDKAFNTHFDKAMESMPEFKDIVNKDTIKALSLLPTNANKTFNQIIEESFGHIVKGKKTIDAGGAANRADETEVDTGKAQSDPEYFKRVMANPELRKKYNDGMTKRLASQL